MTARTVLDTHHMIFHVLKTNGFRVGKVRRDGTVHANRDVLSLETHALRNIEVIARPDGQASITVRKGRGVRGEVIVTGSGKADAPTADLADVAATAIATAARLGG